MLIYGHLESGKSTKKRVDPRKIRGVGAAQVNTTNSESGLALNLAGLQILFIITMILYFNYMAIVLVSSLEVEVSRL